jgi:hypothetical protein
MKICKRRYIGTLFCISAIMMIMWRNLSFKFSQVIKVWNKHAVAKHFHSTVVCTLKLFCLLGMVAVVCRISRFMSVRPYGTMLLPLDGFSWNLIFEDFSKRCLQALINNQLDAQFLIYIYIFIYLFILFRFSAFFEQPCAHHHQESHLYQYNIWNVSLCVGDRPVCRSGRTFPTCIPT